MSEMFCFQCEQTAGGKGCSRVGVCGKQPSVAVKMDELTKQSYQALLPGGRSRLKGNYRINEN